MEKLLHLLIYLLLLPLCVTAQKATLVVRQTGFLYDGFTSPIHISVPGYPCDALLLEAENETYTIEGNGCSYDISPPSGRQSLPLVVRNKKDRSVLDTLIVPVRTLHVALAAGPKGTGPLFAEGPRVLSGADTLPDPFFHITRFRAIVIKDTAVQEFETEGSLYTPATRAALAQAQPGDQLWIEQIRVMGPDKKERPFNSILYTFPR